MEELRIRSIRITDSAYAAQMAAAESEGLPWSIWARRCLMQAAGQQALAPAQVDEIVARANAEAAKPAVPQTPLDRPIMPEQTSEPTRVVAIPKVRCSKRLRPGTYCKECGSVHE